MRLFPPTRRDVLLKLGAAMTALATASLAPPRAFAQGTIRKRKNIESLSSDELSVYKHAIQVLKDHSSDPNDPKGMPTGPRCMTCSTSPFIPAARIFPRNSSPGTGAISTTLKSRCRTATHRPPRT